MSLSEYGSVLHATSTPGSNFVQREEARDGGVGRKTGSPCLSAVVEEWQSVVAVWRRQRARQCREENRPRHEDRGEPMRAGETFARATGPCKWPLLQAYLSAVQWEVRHNDFC